MNQDTLMLMVLMVAPIVAAMRIALSKNPDTGYRTALATSLVMFLPALKLLDSFDFSNGASAQFTYSISWVESLGLNFSIGMDSVSLLLILLSVLLGPIVVMASKTAIVKDKRMYYAWLMVLQGAMVGVFAAQDLLLFYICFEFTLLPMFVLIRKFGSTNRVAASIKFFLYTFTGSMMTLAGMVYIVWFVAQPDQLGHWTLDIATLTQYAANMSLGEQTWVLFAMLAGFAVKVPLFPFHTWLPLAHTEAPTAGSVILAGVLLKLGTYGIYRFAIPLAPTAFFEFAPEIAVLSIIGNRYQEARRVFVRVSLGFLCPRTRGTQCHRIQRLDPLHAQPRSFDRWVVPHDRVHVRTLPHPRYECCWRLGIQDADLGNLHGLLCDGIRRASGLERVPIRSPLPDLRVPV